MDEFIHELRKQELDADSHNDAGHVCVEKHTSDETTAIRTVSLLRKGATVSTATPAATKQSMHSIAANTRRTDTGPQYDS